MKKILKLNLALVLALLFLFETQPAGAADNLSDVTNSLMCTCGCSMVLYSCQCGTGDQMKADIRQMIDGGMDKQEILDSYVSRYDKTILAAPPKEGFNLSAWVMPFAAIGGASILIYILLNRWSARGVAVESYWAKTEINEEELQEVERELHKLED